MSVGFNFNNWEPSTNPVNTQELLDYLANSGDFIPALENFIVKNPGNNDAFLQRLYRHLLSSGQEELAIETVWKMSKGHESAFVEVFESWFTNGPPTSNVLHTWNLWTYEALHGKTVAIALCRVFMNHGFIHEAVEVAQNRLPVSPYVSFEYLEIFKAFIEASNLDYALKIAIAERDGRHGLHVYQALCDALVMADMTDYAIGIAELQEESGLEWGEQLSKNLNSALRARSAYSPEGWQRI